MEHNQPYIRAESLISHLVDVSSFLYAGQSNNGFTVLQSLVKDHVGVTLDRFLFPLWSFVVFLHLFPLYVLQSLEGERETAIILTIQSQQQIFRLHLQEFLVFVSNHLCQDVFGQNLVSMFHHHVDKFTEKQSE